MKLIPYLHSTGTPMGRSLLHDFFKGFPFDDSSQDGWDGWNPSVDILEKDDTLVVRAELPGMDEKDIDLKVEGNTLTLRGERRMEKEDSKSNYRRVESRYGAFTRSFRLPDKVDFEKIAADYKKGVLTITVPYKQDVKPREIPVSVH